ncbi:MULTISPECIES: hypothetical protein [Cyanophyceae]|uniref:Uncharacterized protein n=1 Tax=Leptolyngbya subtilissima DQ-A4 TaxID=2933933 RepID=A0ABV0K9V0_9CYAN|nr:hypothetical protein [Nodosilinea sp. FACHB-141]MBD2110891.1 hypothetical protein [Nodosilinea sp. FACHB-141]
MKDVRPITPTTVWPLRVLGTSVAEAVLIMVGAVLLVEGIDHYQLWQADGI